MDPHPYFALHLHNNQELTPFLPSAVTARETLHEWPLFCVQRLHCEDGITFIYKVQSAPSVEPEFYRQARSSLLVTAQILPEDIHAALRGKTGHVHGDLRAENVLLTADGDRVLDWQRPRWGCISISGHTKCRGLFVAASWGLLSCRHVLREVPGTFAPA